MIKSYSTKKSTKSALVLLAVALLLCESQAFGKKSMISSKGGYYHSSTDD
jgi:hypothetical protein